MSKHSWFGTVIAIQPRFRLLRSIGRRQHNYLGYVLTIDGQIEGQSQRFTVAIGKGAQQKHHFRAGDEVAGNSQKVLESPSELAQYYKTSGLKVLMRESTEETISSTPPYVGVAPEIEAYRRRGHRRLEREIYDQKCNGCVWGALMPTEVMGDNWNPRDKQYRLETFCYGPKACPFYQAGPPRMIENWIEPDEIDNEETRHRGLYD